METNSSPGHDSPTAQQIAHMQATGKLTAEEAVALDSDDANQREAVLRQIRVRHASARLKDAKAQGAVTNEEAVDLIEQVQRGGHSAALRSRVNKVSRQATSKRDVGDSRTK